MIEEQELPPIIQTKFEWIGEHGKGIDKCIYIEIMIDVRTQMHSIEYQVYSQKMLQEKTMDLDIAIEVYVNC